MKRKYVALLLTISMLLGLAACAKPAGSSHTGTSSTAGGEATPSAETPRQSAVPDASKAPEQSGFDPTILDGSKFISIHMDGATEAGFSYPIVLDAAAGMATIHLQSGKTLQVDYSIYEDGTMALAGSDAAGEYFEYIGSYRAEDDLFVALYVDSHTGGTGESGLDVKGLTLDEMALREVDYYENGRAWVRYLDEDLNLVYCAVNERGSIAFTLDEAPFFTSGFYEGTAFYRVGDKPSWTDNVRGLWSVDVIIDENGREIYRTSFDETSKQWEHILGYDEQGFIMARQTMGIEDATVSLGIMGRDGNMVVDYIPMSQLGLGNAYFNIESYDRKDHIIGLGEGWFQIVSGNDVFRTINLQKKKLTDLVPLSGMSFQDGYIYGINSSSRFLYKADTDFNIVQKWETADEMRITARGIYNNMIHYYDRKKNNWYCDLDGNEVLRLDSFYPNNYKWVSDFRGEYAVAVIRGADDRVYCTVLDRQGEPLFDPIPTSYDAYNYDGTNYTYEGQYLFMENENEKMCIYDLEGNLIHDFQKDFDSYTDNKLGGSFKYEGQRGGYVKISYDERITKLDSVNRKTFYKLIPLSDYIACGDKVYPINITTKDLGSGSSSSTSSGYTAPEKDYKKVSGFAIEGKWKSVGSYGFGQAQPGAIVVFDGAHCNLFSPNDTYALTKSGDFFKLDCTSFMSTDTVTFTVKTIDKDHCDLIRGGYVTELERVG